MGKAELFILGSVGLKQFPSDLQIKPINNLKIEFELLTQSSSPIGHLVRARDGSISLSVTSWLF